MAVDFDLVVVGGGVAGLTAAGVAASNGVRILVVEQLAPGGQIATVESIRNFPGFPEGIGGYELGPNLQQQAEESGAEMAADTVDEIVRTEEGFRVVGAERTVTAHAVIVAAGSRRKALGVPGEKPFEGRGVSHCASCDGQFFRGQAVIVAGGGDSAFDEAEILAAHAASVTIVHHGAAPVAQRRTVERVTALPNLTVLARSEIVAIEGDGGVGSVTIATDGSAGAIPCAGVFVYVGLEPNAGFVGDLVDRDMRGAILAGDDMQTRTPGLFVAGDIRSGATALLASVAGDGARAALSAVAYLSTVGSVAMAL
jgi:thioredoxin reductase (NADPH)